MTRTLAILLCLICGCAPRVVIFSPPVEINETPDLRGCVKVQSDAGRASAAVVASRGPHYFCVTARHAVLAADWILVDGRLAELYAYSVTSDLALLRFKSNKQYTVYPVETPRLGEACWIVGWPWPGRVVNRGWISRVEDSAVWHNAGGAMGCSGAGVLGIRNGRAVLLGTVTSYLTEMDSSWFIPSRNVYDSIGRAESATDIARLMRLLPEP